MGKRRCCSPLRFLIYHVLKNSYVGGWTGAAGGVKINSENCCNLLPCCQVSRTQDSDSVLLEAVIITYNFYGWFCSLLGPSEDEYKSVHEHGGCSRGHRISEELGHRYREWERRGWGHTVAIGLEPQSHAHPATVLDGWSLVPFPKEALEQKAELRADNILEQILLSNNLPRSWFYRSGK